MDTRVTGDPRKDALVRITMEAIAERTSAAVADYGDTITDGEKSLLNYIHMVGGLNEMNARPNARYPQGYYGLVLEYGQFWQPATCPVPRMTVKECFSNALHLAREDVDLTYVEGYAHSPLIPTLHAWCVDPDGYVVDPTWDSPEDSAYFGIAFDTEFVTDLVYKQGYYGVLGNDWTNDAQIIRYGLVMDRVAGRNIAIDVGEA